MCFICEDTRDLLRLWWLLFLQQRTKWNIWELLSKCSNMKCNSYIDKYTTNELVLVFIIWYDMTYMDNKHQQPADTGKFCHFWWIFMAFDFYFEHTGTGFIIGRFEEIYAYISNFPSTSQLKHYEIMSAFWFPPPDFTWWIFQNYLNFIWSKNIN